MKRWLVLTVVTMLAGCAPSPTLYEPLGSNGGYSEVQVNETTYEVRASVNYRSYPERADDLVLIRAAEITCSKGYPYFDVLNKQMQLTQGSREAASLTTSFLTIRMAKEPSKESYNAVTVLKNMNQKYKNLHEKVSCIFN